MALENRSFSKQARRKLNIAVRDGVTDKNALYAVLREHNSAVRAAVLDNEVLIKLAKDTGDLAPDLVNPGSTVPESEFDFYIEICTAKTVEEYHGKHKALPWDRWGARFKGFFWVGSFWRQLAALFARKKKALAAPASAAPPESAEKKGLHVVRK